jgi:hypothetical protein
LKVGPYQVDLKASLSQNLSLTLLPESQGLSLAADSPETIGSLAALAAGIDPAQEKLVLILRNAPTPEVEQAIAFFKQQKIQVVVHPKPDKLPLKFGMPGAFAP